MSDKDTRERVAHHLIENTFRCFSCDKPTNIFARVPPIDKAYIEVFCDSISNEMNEFIRKFGLTLNNNAIKQVNTYYLDTFNQMMRIPKINRYIHEVDKPPILFYDVKKFQETTTKKNKQILNPLSLIILMAETMNVKGFNSFGLLFEDDFPDPDLDMVEMYAESEDNNSFFVHCPQRLSQTPILNWD